MCDMCWCCCCLLCLLLSQLLYTITTHMACKIITQHNHKTSQCLSVLYVFQQNHEWVYMVARVLWVLCDYFCCVQQLNTAHIHESHWMTVKQSKNKQFPTDLCNIQRIRPWCGGGQSRKNRYILPTKSAGRGGKVRPYQMTKILNLLLLCVLLCKTLLHQKTFYIATHSWTKRYSKN